MIYNQSQSKSNLSSIDLKKPTKLALIREQQTPEEILKDGRFQIHHKFLNSTRRST